MKLEKEGPAEHFFPPLDAVSEEVLEDQSGTSTRVPQAVTEILRRGRVDESHLQDLAGVVEIDDDNEPAPENVPQGEAEDNIFQPWGHNNVCHQRMLGAQQTKASLKH